MSWFGLLWNLIAGKDAREIEDHREKLEDHERRITELERRRDIQEAVRRIADGGGK